MTVAKAEVGSLVAQGATKAGAGVAVVGGITAHEFAAIGGLIIAVISMAYNIYARERLIRRAREFSGHRCPAANAGLCPLLKDDAPPRD